MSSRLLYGEGKVVLIFIESSFLLRLWKDKVNHINRKKPGNICLLVCNFILMKESINIFSACYFSE